LLKHIKEQVTELIKVTTPNGSLQVIDIDDNTSLEKVEFVVGVGIMATLAKRGIIGLKAQDFYRDIIDNSLCDDKVIRENMQEIVSLCLPYILKGSPCPIWKYLSIIGDKDGLHRIIQKQITKESSINGFRTHTINQTIQKAQNSRILEYRQNNYTIKDIRKRLGSACKCIDQVLFLKDECIKKDELLNLIKEVLVEHPSILEITCTGYKKLIRIYDFLENKK
jgi:hypothetical protein